MYLYNVCTYICVVFNKTSSAHNTGFSGPEYIEFTTHYMIAHINVHCFIYMYMYIVSLVGSDTIIPNVNLKPCRWYWRETGN